MHTHAYEPAENRFKHSWKLCSKSWETALRGQVMGKMPVRAAALSRRPFSSRLQGWDSIDRKRSTGRQISNSLPSHPLLTKYHFRVATEEINFHLKQTILFGGQIIAAGPFSNLCRKRERMKILGTRAHVLWTPPPPCSTFGFYFWQV